jgi:hypothetical protein
LYQFCGVGEWSIYFLFFSFLFSFDFDGSGRAVVHVVKKHVVIDQGRRLNKAAGGRCREVFKAVEKEKVGLRLMLPSRWCFK